MSRFNEWQPPEIIEGQDSRWGWRVSHVDGLKLGQRVDIGYGCYIQAQRGVTIEDDVQLGAHCVIYSVNTIDGVWGPVIIKRGVCIGAHSVIFPGVIIGEGAKIGAMSLVKHDVPAGELWYGIPAKRGRVYRVRPNGEASHSSGRLRFDREGDRPSVQE